MAHISVKVEPHKSKLQVSRDWHVRCAAQTQGREGAGGAETPTKPFHAANILPELNGAINPIGSIPAAVQGLGVVPKYACEGTLCSYNTFYVQLIAFMNSRLAM